MIPYIETANSPFRLVDSNHKYNFIVLSPPKNIPIDVLDIKIPWSNTLTDDSYLWMFYMKHYTIYISVVSQGINQGISMFTTVYEI
jgi:hypothetical protein